MTDKSTLKVDIDVLINQIIATLQETKVAQVPGYVRFKYDKITDSSIILIRENGNEAKIPFSTLYKAIEAVREDASVYNGGPNKLREHGITHINSPTWALLHLVPFNELI